MGTKLFQDMEDRREKQQNRELVIRPQLEAQLEMSDLVSEINMEDFEVEYMQEEIQEKSKSEQQQL